MYTPHPNNPYPQSSREHWKWFHANDPRSKTTPAPTDKIKADSQKRHQFWGGSVNK